MRFRIDKWLVVLVVAALSTLSWWMPFEPGPVATLVAPPEKRHISDYYLADFELTTMNAAGRPRYRLQGRDMTHYLDDDTSQVDQPKLTMYRQDAAAPWFVRAEQGQVATGGESVLLQDQVIVERLTDIARDKLEIQTTVLTVLPSRQYAETDRPVTVLTDVGVTHGVGMTADLKQEQLHLLAEVRGEYAKP